MPAQFFRDSIADSSTLCPAPQQHPADNIDLCNHHTVIFPHLSQGKPGSVGSKRRGLKWRAMVLQTCWKGALVSVGVEGQGW